MRSRRFLAALIVLCAALAGFLVWRRTHPDYDAAHLLQTLPLNRAVKVYIDAGALRSAGLLDLVAGSRAAEEADYRRFVEQTGFDYRTDLDAIAAAFVDGSGYFAVRGRFHWNRLSDYARAQQGSCANSVCSMPATRPDRVISFYPLAGDVLALAVTGNARSALDISPASGKPPVVAPSAPVWISAPGAAFRDLNGLPSGSRVLSPLADSQEAVFSIRAAGQDRFEVRMDATYPAAEGAQKAAQQLIATTNLLRSMLARDKLTPNPADLSGPLTAGKFEVQASHVIGTWPFEKQFFQALLTAN